MCGVNLLFNHGRYTAKNSRPQGLNDTLTLNSLRNKCVLARPLAEKGLEEHSNVLLCVRLLHIQQAN